MKQFIVDTTVFIMFMLCFWAAGMIVNTLIFCLFLDRNNPDSTMNYFFMVEINKILVIPAFFVANHFTNNKNE